MIEYRITTPAKISIVKTLWKKFLKADPMWHFTLEGSYIEVRVSDRIPALDAYLKNKKIPYSTFAYKDNIPVTRKYQKAFEHIFHGYSELSMHASRPMNIDWEIDGRSHVRQILERCIHLACNILGFSQGGETKAVSAHSLERAYTSGMNKGGLETFYEFHARKNLEKSKKKGKKV